MKDAAAATKSYELPLSALLGRQQDPIQQDPKLTERQPLRGLPGASAKYRAARNGPRRRRTRFATLTACGIALAAGFATAPAQAHGRFPASGLVALGPSSDQRIVVRTTYGLVMSLDRGASWRWVCGEAPNYDPDTEDPVVLLDDAGRMALGAFDGLAASSNGCSWELVGGGLAGRYVVDLVAKESGAGWLALSSNGVAADTFDVGLWAADEGQTAWSLVHDFPNDDLLALTVGVGGAGSNRVFVSGRDGLAASEPGASDSYAGVVMRSDDGGSSWQRFAVPGSDGSTRLPYLAAVDPSDASRLYVAIISIPSADPYFELMVSTDGAESYSSIYTSAGGASAFALSPDGSRLALGGSAIGLLTADRDNPQFEQVNKARIGCINWHPTGMWLCTDEFVDGATLQRSQDEGLTLTPVMGLASPCGSLDCPEASTVAQLCAPRWPAEAKELQAPLSCEPGLASESAASCRIARVAMTRAEGSASDQESKPRQGPWALFLFLGLGLTLRRACSSASGDPERQGQGAAAQR